MHFGGVEVVLETVHKTADGRRLLVVHGDQFDGIVRHAKAIAVLGTWAYDLALRVNHWFNVARRLVGLPYWSLSAYLKHKVKNAVEFIAKFEDEMIAETRAAGPRRRGLRPHPPRGDPRRRTGSSTATTATGWRAAPRWSRISTASSASCTGPTSGASSAKRRGMKRARHAEEVLILHASVGAGHTRAAKAIAAALALESPETRASSSTCSIWRARFQARVRRGLPRARRARALFIRVLSR